MNTNFDELAKGLAYSVTRRAALKRFGVGLASFTLAALGFENSAHAGNDKETGGGNCNHCSGAPYYGCVPDDQACIQRCTRKCCVICPK